MRPKAERLDNNETNAEIRLQLVNRAFNLQAGASEMRTSIAELPHLSEADLAMRLGAMTWGAVQPTAYMPLWLIMHAKFNELRSRRLLSRANNIPDVDL